MAWDTPFDEFPSEDQEVWRQRAYDWYELHRLHVGKLLFAEDVAYPPSGSDCGKPELYKGGHWRWIFKLGNVSNENREV